MRDVFGISSEDSDSNTSSNDEMNINLLKGNLLVSLFYFNGTITA